MNTQKKMQKVWLNFILMLLTDRNFLGIVFIDTPCMHALSKSIANSDKFTASNINLWLLLLIDLWPFCMWQLFRPQHSPRMPTHQHMNRPTYFHVPDDPCRLDAYRLSETDMSVPWWPGCLRLKPSLQHHSKRDLVADKAMKAMGINLGTTMTHTWNTIWRLSSLLRRQVSNHKTWSEGQITSHNCEVWKLPEKEARW